MDEPTLALFWALYRSLYEHFVYANWTHERSKRALLALQEAARVLRAHGSLPEDPFNLLAAKEEAYATTTKAH